jgi:hypothetical protein
MISKNDFVKAFRETMSGKLSTKEFARLAGQYFQSPEYNRWKAVQSAEDLKGWREGRDYLMSLIEAEKKAGTQIDYEILPLREGHDSVKVIVNGRPTVYFPSYFGKESIDMNWTHVMEAKQKPSRACGRADCGTSTSIDDVTLTFGRGDLDDHGFWEFPCVICAEAFQKEFPSRSVWPVKNAPQQG